MKLTTGLSIIVLFSFLLLVGCLGVNDEGLSFEKQLDKDLEEIDAYLAANSITALKDPDDLIRYVIHEEGTGSVPKLSGCVTAAYEGKFYDGITFDEDEDVAFPLNAVILGWQIGMPLLQQGDSATLYIPSGLGYGTQGAHGIPGNTNLIFHVRLKHVGTVYDGASGTCL